MSNNALCWATNLCRGMSNNTPCVTFVLAAPSRPPAPKPVSWCTQMVTGNLPPDPSRPRSRHGCHRLRVLPRRTAPSLSALSARPARAADRGQRGCRYAAIASQIEAFSACVGDQYPCALWRPLRSRPAHCQSAFPQAGEPRPISSEGVRRRPTA